MNNLDASGILNVGASRGVDLTQIPENLDSVATANVNQRSARFKSCWARV